MNCPSCKREFESLKMQDIMATDKAERLFGTAWVCPHCQAVIGITNYPVTQHEIADEVIRRLNSKPQK